MNFCALGQRIQKIRNRRCMTQQELAEASSLSVPHISHIETGRKQVSLCALIRIAEALNVTVDQLLIGNQSTAGNSLQAEMQDVLVDCTPQEQRLLIAVAEAVKASLRTLE